MSELYVVKKDSEADQLINKYEETVKNNIKKIKKIAKRLNVGTKCFITGRDGSIMGFEMLDGNILPDGWAKAKGHWGYAFPRRLKANKELREEIGEIQLDGGSHLMSTVFTITPWYSRGRSSFSFCGWERIGERSVFSFVDQGHIDCLMKQGGTWPKGLRKVKGSTVERWKEAISDE